MATGKNVPLIKIGINVELILLVKKTVKNVPLMKLVKSRIYEIP